MTDNFVEEEYAAQLFSVRPSDLVSGLHEDVKYGFKNHEKLLEGLLKRLPKEVLSDEDRDKGLQMLRTETSIKIDETFEVLLDHFKSVLLRIPDDLVLEEDSEQKIQHTIDDKKMLEEELASLRLQIANEKFMISKLKEEAKEVNRVLEIQNNHLNNIVSKCDSSAIKENVIFYAENSKFEQLTSNESDEFIENFLRIDKLS